MYTYTHIVTYTLIVILGGVVFRGRGVVRGCVLAHLSNSFKLMCVYTCVYIYIYMYACTNHDDHDATYNASHI